MGFAGLILPEVLMTTMRGRVWTLVSILPVVLCLSASASAAETLATYSLSAGWATFGLALPPGKAFSAVAVGSLPTQTDVKVRYADQSIRFAVVTARIPSAGTYAI